MHWPILARRRRPLLLLAAAVLLVLLLVVLWCCWRREGQRRKEASRCVATVAGFAGRRPSSLRRFGWVDWVWLVGLGWRLPIRVKSRRGSGSGALEEPFLDSFWVVSSDNIGDLKI